MTRRIPQPWRQRLWAAALLGCSLLLHLLFPARALAACGPLDIPACTDGIEYSTYYGMATALWNANRFLLILAYQLDQLRAWMNTVVFTGLYQFIADLVEPTYVPIATAALTIAAILTFLTPITGQIRFVTLRHVLIWAVLTPAILITAGNFVGQAEQLRSSVSAQIAGQVAGIAPGAIFGPAGSDMGAVAALYPSNPCGATLTRPGAAGVALDSLAAALLYADAGDIFCPDARAPSRDIPDGFYLSPPAFAYDGSVAELDSAVERRGWVEGMQRGVSRLAQGLVPAFCAAAESFIHLIFSLNLVILWVSVPFGLMFVWFQQTAAVMSGFLPRAIGILQMSWTSSVLLGLIGSCLSAAAQLSNAGAYTGLALGAALLLIYLSVVALGGLKESLAAASAILTGGMSGFGADPIGATVGAAGAAVGMGWSALEYADGRASAGARAAGKTAIRMGALGAGAVLASMGGAGSPPPSPAPLPGGAPMPPPSGAPLPPPGGAPAPVPPPAPAPAPTGTPPPRPTTPWSPPASAPMPPPAPAPAGLPSPLTPWSTPPPAPAGTPPPAPPAPPAPNGSPPPAPAGAPTSPWSAPPSGSREE